MWRVWLIFFSSNRGKPYGKFLKFITTGGVGFLVDLAIVVFLVEVVKLNLYLANCCSFIVAVTVVFLINKFWTFKDSSEAYAKQYFKYFMVSLGGLAWNFLLLNLFVDTLGIWYVYAKIIITVIVAFWNFFVNNYWTFKKV
ncbi:MAG: GtrA family protein [Patescibacteria group bacterium]|nr:GtrA family protein [Patescibacteria group bacterium]